MTCRSSRQQTSWTLGSSSSRWREKETWASSRLFRNLCEINMILMVVVMFRIRPILRQNWSQGWLWQHWCVWWAIGQATCYERAAEYQLVRLQLSLWLSATPSPWESARCLPEDFTIQSPCHPYRAPWLPGYFTIQSAKSSISRSLVETRHNFPRN